MVRITEEQCTDLDGRVRKVRKIEAARARIEHPDGTVEEYSGTTAVHVRCRTPAQMSGEPDTPLESKPRRRRLVVRQRFLGNGPAFAFLASGRDAHSHNGGYVNRLADFRSNFAI